MNEAGWSTDEALQAANRSFAATVPGYEPPAAYAVARRDGTTLTFGHVNRPGGGHLLPAVVLASVCDHRGGTATYPLSAEQMTEAVRLLAPAEAATHYTHPNLWSWRALLDGATATSTFVALFVADLADAPTGTHDAELRSRLARE